MMFACAKWLHEHAFIVFTLCVHFLSLNLKHKRCVPLPSLSICPFCCRRCSTGAHSWSANLKFCCISLCWAVPPFHHAKLSSNLWHYNKTCSDINNTQPFHFGIGFCSMPTPNNRFFGFFFITNFRFLFIFWVQLDRLSVRNLAEVEFCAGNVSNSFP